MRISMAAMTRAMTRLKIFSSFGELGPLLWGFARKPPSIFYYGLTVPEARWACREIFQAHRELGFRE